MTTANDMTACSHCGHRNPSWYAACEQCGSYLSLASSDYALKRKAILEKPQIAQTQQRMTAMAHVLCGWPLILVGIGGAIGGALGAAAYAINLAIYKGTMPGIFKVVLNLVVGTSAIAGWLIIASALRK